MWNPVKKIASFTAWCSECKGHLKIGDPYIKDGVTQYCMGCAIKSGYNNTDNTPVPLNPIRSNLFQP